MVQSQNIFGRDIQDLLCSVMMIIVNGTQRYKPDKFTFDRLKSEYGIYAVRGPRGIPNSLSAALK